MGAWMYGLRAPSTMRACEIKDGAGQTTIASVGAARFLYKPTYSWELDAISDRKCHRAERAWDHAAAVPRYFVVNDRPKKGERVYRWVDTERDPPICFIDDDTFGTHAVVVGVISEVLGK